MKLQSQHLIAHTEGLMRAGVGGGKQGGLPWNFELITVPVQHWRSRCQRRQHRIRPCLRQGDGAKADFLVAHGRHSRTQSTSNELRAQADAEDRLAAGKALANEFEFIRQERVGRFVESTDGSAQHDEEIRGYGIQLSQCVKRGFDHADLITLHGQYISQAPQPFKGQMA